MKKLVINLGGIPHILSQEDKVLYHAACTLVSSGLVSLIGTVQKIMKDQSRMEMFWPLAQVTLDNMIEKGIEKSLTGPIQRGDVRTVQRHLETLWTTHSDLLPIYLLLNKKILEMSVFFGLQNEKVKSFKKLFDTFQKDIK
jgi:predicted short-subunit dehydrogenase-like oxidoreductase (DUF2520 family)